MKKQDGESSKLDRKTVEKNRRINMKNLCFKLSSLIPPRFFNSPREIVSQQDQLYYAASHIKQLKERVEKLNARKEETMGLNGSNLMITSNASTMKFPLIEVRDLDSTIQVNVISGLMTNFKLYQIIRVVEEEGAQVVGASFFTKGDTSFHTLHAMVKVSRVGVETTILSQRLKALFYS